MELKQLEGLPLNWVKQRNKSELKTSKAGLDIKHKVRMDQLEED